MHYITLLYSILLVWLSVSEDSVKPSRPAVSSPAQRHLRLSPKKKSGLTPDLESSPKNRIGERIQTRIPLKEQRSVHAVHRITTESVRTLGFSGPYQTVVHLSGLSL